MSDNSNSVGCWGWLQYVWEWLESIWQFIMFIVFGYSIVIRILAAILKVKLEELPDWALVVGLLFSIPAVLLASKLLDGFLSILKTIFTWLGTILIGTLLLIVFVYLHLHLWISVSGLIFLVIGVLRTPVGGWKEPAAMAFNRLSAEFLGAVMIIVGFLTFFLDKRT